ncbi:hypothetical protein D1BOALGB6SA_10138 [Olavius sp. associated proteobacterium Delta 1]|nr:hypothetical protein D1BOALGB6SA_10138 [Olavius sp. associated proteobacterium Delta 1]
MVAKPQARLTGLIEPGCRFENKNPPAGISSLPGGMKVAIIAILIFSVQHGEY